MCSTIGGSMWKFGQHSSYQPSMPGLVVLRERRHKVMMRLTSLMRLMKLSLVAVTKTNGVHEDRLLRAKRLVSPRKWRRMSRGPIYVENCTEWLHSTITATRAGESSHWEMEDDVLKRSSFADESLRSFSRPRSLPRQRRRTATRC